MSAVRRERNYTQFPRNTKERHVRTCASEARAAAKQQAEVEACYGEWEPTQVHNVDEMEDAQLTAWCGIDLTIPRGQLKREWELDMIERDRADRAYA